MKISVMIASMGCCLGLLTGCAGPKMITSQPSSTKVMGPIPPKARLFVATTCGDPVANSVVRAKLAKALLRTGRFSSVEYGTATSDGLQMTLEIHAKPSLWRQRAFTGDFTRVSAGGGIASGATELVSFHESRSGAGGLFGAGGWTTCGEKHMVKTLTRWLVRDLAERVEQAPANEQ